MEYTCKHFSELTPEEMYEIYKVRVSVFVVEQKCPYQEIDDADRLAYHLYLRDEEGIQAYARALPPGATFPEASIGRVLSVRRGCGLGRRIAECAVRTVREKFSADQITIEAQTHARGLYENLGFRQVSEEFTEDGIPHILMRLEM